MTDITVGEEPQLRGHWLDRLPAIDADIAALQAMLPLGAAGPDSPKVVAAMQVIMARTRRAVVSANHTPPSRFTRGEAIPLSLASRSAQSGVRLHYRHVDQAENYVVAEMKLEGGQYTSAIPAEYTKTEFPLEYFFELNTKGEGGVIYPGFLSELTNRPYFVIRSV